MQNISTYVINCSFNWGNYKNLVNFTNDIISSTNYFNNLTFINTVFVFNKK